MASLRLRQPPASVVGIVGVRISVALVVLVFVPSPRSTDDSRLLTELIELELRLRFTLPLASAPAPAPAPVPPPLLPLKLPPVGLRPSWPPLLPSGIGGGDRRWGGELAKLPKNRKSGGSW